MIQPADEAFVVLDTETTGLPHQSFARVIEIGAVVVGAPQGAFHPCEPFQSLVFPDTFEPTRSARAMQVNGLDPDDFFFAPRPAQVQARFEEWLRASGVPDADLFAWNGSFDHRMLERSGFEGLVIHDIRRVVRDMCVHAGLRKFRSLSAACSLLRVPEPVEGRHRAVTDAALAADCWLAARKQAGLA